jgi:NhaP-type Na+/H+ or K+/H+ antiporter
MENALFQIVAIALASMTAQWLGWRLKIPAIVFLLLSGFILGPMLHVVRPHELMGNFLRPAITAAVAIILFEGSLNLKLREVSDVKAAVRHIVLIGAPLGWGLIAVAAHCVAGLSWPVAITFGGMLVVTGPTVVIPMLRNAKLSPRVSSILKWEGIINDPLGVIFAVISLEYFRFHRSLPASGLSFYFEYGTILIVMLIASYALGRLTAFILEHGFLPEYLKAPFLVTAVLALYAVCDIFLQESGLISIVVFGMTLANVRVSSLEEIKRFKETITLLLVSGIFILLTANLDPKMLLSIDARGFIFIALLLFVLRPLTIFLSSLGTSMTRKEALFIGWIAPRGVVCAAMAGVMQPLLLDAGFDDAGQILPLAFSVVIVTVVLHSFSIKWWAHKLELSTEQTGGLIIVGASEWSLQLAETLLQKEIPVVVTDTNWHVLKAGRLVNIPVYYGEMLSEEAEYNMELHRYGALLAASANDSYNTLLCNAYSPLLGSEHVYQLSSGQEQEAERKKVAINLQGRIFVEAARGFSDWRRSYAMGWRFHLTTINPTENDGKRVLQENEIFVGVINKNGILSCRTSEYEPPIKEGDNILIYSLKTVDETTKESSPSQN